jgi:CHAT domain-containing protein/tetratricopeptide (TPR) repeat protein
MSHSIDALLADLEKGDVSRTELVSLANTHGFADEYSLSELLDEAEQRMRDDPQAAGLLALAGRETATKINATPLEARGAYLSGIAAAVSFDYPVAFQRIDEAEHLFRSCGRERDALRTNLGRAQLLIQTARQDDARAACDAVLIGIDANDTSPEAVSFRATANQNIGISYDSQGRFEEALHAYELAEAGFASIDAWSKVAEVAHNRGLVLSMSAQHDKALVAFDRAATEFARSGLRARHAMTLADSAEAHLALGDYRSCLANLEESRKELRTIGAPESDHQRQMVAARAYLALNLFPEALAVLDEASAGLENSEVVLESALVQLARGFALRSLRRFDQAEAALDHATKLFEAVGNHQWLAAAKIEQSAIAAYRGNLDLAASLASDALDYVGHTDAPVERIRACLQLASAIEAAGGDPLATLRTAFNEVSTLILPSLHTYTATRLATQLLATGGLEEATSLLEKAVEASEQLRSGVDDTSLLSAFFVDKHDAYTTLARVRLDSGDVSGTLSLLEAAKARSLSDMVTGVHRERAASAPVKAVTANLTTTIAYGELDGEIVAFIRNADDLLIVRTLTTLREVAAEVRHLDAQWDRFRAGPEFAHRNAQSLENSARRSLHRLYEMLVQPLQKYLNQVSAGVTPLVIVPTGILHRIPFHALHDGSNYLIETFEVSYAPSLAVADQTAALRPLTIGKALLLAAPDDRAPGVAREVAECAAILENAIVLIGSGATTEALATGVSGSRLVHLACHGMFRADNPMFSSLRLHDRWITAAELLELDFTNRTVVFSACESARSDTAQGDEILGLTRAVFGAGAATLVAGLWLADDAATAALMPAFYRDLANQGAAAALRTAQLALATRMPHPYYWSPFVVIGHR